MTHLYCVKKKQREKVKWKKIFFFVDGHDCMAEGLLTYISVWCVRYTSLVAVCCAMWTGIICNLRGYRISPNDRRLGTDAVQNKPFVYTTMKTLQLLSANLMKPSWTWASRCVFHSPCLCVQSRAWKALVPGDRTIFSTCTLCEGNTPCTQSILRANGAIVRQEWLMPNKAWRRQTFSPSTIRSLLLIAYSQAEAQPRIWREAPPPNTGTSKPRFHPICPLLKSVRPHWYHQIKQ